MLVKCIQLRFKVMVWYFQWLCGSNCACRSLSPKSLWINLTLSSFSLLKTMSSAKGRYYLSLVTDPLGFHFVTILLCHLSWSICDQCLLFYATHPGTHVCKNLSFGDATHSFWDSNPGFVKSCPITLSLT